MPYIFIINTTIHPNNEAAVRMRKLFILLSFSAFHCWTTVSTLLAEAFSQRCTAIPVLVARDLFWLFLCRGKDLCRQPFGIPVEHARDENAVTMEFLSRVGNTMPPPEFAHVFMSQFSHGNDSHSPC